MAGRTIHRLREIHGPDVEIALVGRPERRRAGAYAVAPEPARRPSFKEVVNGIGLAFVVIPAMCALALLALGLFGFASLIVYAGLYAFGAPQWLAGSVTAVFAMFVITLLWVNRR